MTNTKRVHLMQHLRHGDKKVKTRDLDLSLDEDEVDYYICRQNGSVQIREDFELLSAEGKDMDTLAILRQHLIVFDHKKLTIRRHSRRFCVSRSAGSRCLRANAWSRIQWQIRP